MLGVPVAIVGNVYIIWNTVLTVFGVRICVQEKPIGYHPLNSQFAGVKFCRKDGSEPENAGSAMNILLLFVFIGLGFGWYAMAIIQVTFEKLDLTTNTYSLVILPASILFSGIYVYFLTSEGFSLKAETKFEASVFTVGLIVVTFLAFFAIQSIVEFIVLQIVNSIEGYMMFVSVLPIVIISIVIIIWRNRIIYSVIDMWIDVLEGNMKARSGESKNRFRRLFSAIKNRNNVTNIPPPSFQPTVHSTTVNEIRNNNTLPRPNYRNPDSIVHEITAPSTITQNVAPSALKSNLCSTCGGRKSLSDIYCPNCGH